MLVRSHGQDHSGLRETFGSYTDIHLGILWLDVGLVGRYTIRESRSKIHAAFIQSARFSYKTMNIYK